MKPSGFSFSANGKGKAYMLQYTRIRTPLLNVSCKFLFHCKLGSFPVFFFDRLNFRFFILEHILYAWTYPYFNFQNFIAFFEGLKKRFFRVLIKD